MPAIQFDNPMNMYDKDQAEVHAKRNPHDAHAQALWAHWVTSLQQFEAARLARAQAAAQPPQLSRG